MARISQEFYCGECKHYFFVRLNSQLTHEVLIVCPNTACNHEHRRCVVNGEIRELGRFQSDIREEIVSTPVSLSKEPRTLKMRNAALDRLQAYSGRRDGVTIECSQLWTDIALRDQGVET